MDEPSRFIQKVSIRNFLAYKELDVEGFDPNINLIIGTNGSGKTSFFKSIEFALTTNVRYTSQLFNKLANDQEIKVLSVSVQLANEYAFTRRLLPLTENYLINEKPVNAAMYHHLIKYYFLDSSLLIPQGKIHQLVASSDRLAAELARFSASMNNVDGLRAIAQQLLAKFDSIDEYRTKLFNDLQGDMQAKQEDQMAAERISRIRDEIKLVQTVMQARKIDSLKQRIKRKREKYDEVKRALNDLVEERVSKETELNRLRRALEEEEVPVNGLSQEDALKELTIKKVQLDLESEDCESQLLEKQEQQSRLAEQLASVRQEIERKQAILAEQKVKLDELKEAEQALAKDVKTKRFDLDQLFSHAGESDGAARKQQAKQQVETLKKEIAELRKHLDELTSRRAAVGEQVKQLSADQAKNDEAIEKAKQAIARLKIENLNCETLRRKLCAEIDKHKGRLNKYEDKKRDFYPLLGRSFLKGKENLNRVIELLREGTDEEQRLVDGYYGLFIDIISFDSTFVIPIERTAKHYLHKHIVKDANTANRLIRKFDEMKLDGTCEFVALDLLKNKTVPQEESSNQYYSFEVGNVLFVILNSEVYYFSKFKESDVLNQERWFNTTMAEANKRRHLVPWVIAVIHRPLYCSASAAFRCTNGVNEKLRKQLDDLFYNTGVDIIMYGHNHHYERMHPTHRMKVKIDDRSKDIIRNPKASIHIISGAGGNQEGLNNFMQTNIPDWSAVRIKENGFLRVKGYNYTHLYAEFFSTTTNEIKDQFWVYSERHEPFKQIAGPSSNLVENLKVPQKVGPQKIMPQKIPPV